MITENAENNLVNIFKHKTYSNQLNLKFSVLFSYFVMLIIFYINLEKTPYLRAKVSRKVYKELACIQGGSSNHCFTYESQNSF